MYQGTVHATAHSHVYTGAMCICACRGKKCTLACSFSFRANLLSYPFLHFLWEVQLIAFCFVCTCPGKIDPPPALPHTGHLPPHHMTILSFDCITAMYLEKCIWPEPFVLKDAC